MENFDFTTIKNTKVVAARMLDDDKVEFLTKENEWSSNLFLANFEKKHNLFDIACELPNWNEICGRVCFLSESELLELYPENTHLWLKENLAKKIYS